MLQCSENEPIFWPHKMTVQIANLSLGKQMKYLRKMSQEFDYWLYKVSI